MTPETCPFCYPNRPILYEDEKARAIQTPDGHIVIVPKKHLPCTLTSLEQCKYLLDVPRKLGITRFELIIHINYHISIPHFHIHLYPK